MNYMARKKRRQNNKVFIGIIIALGIIVSIYLLSIINIPLLSNVSSKIVYGIDAMLGSISGVITQGTSYVGNTKKLNEMLKEKQQYLSTDKDH